MIMTEKQRNFCGKSVYWELEQKNGRITVYGEGPMTDYEGVAEAPWHAFRDQIKELIVAEGVTTLGDYSFIQCPNLARVTLAQSVEIIGVFSLSECTSLREITLPEGVRIISAKAFSGTVNLERISMPISLRAIDMRVFDKVEKLAQVVYAGTVEQWRQIRVSPDERGNRPLYDAAVTFLAENLTATGVEPENIPAKMCERTGLQDRLRDVLKQGGDGTFYVLSLGMTAENLTKKPGDCSLLVFPDGQTMLIDAGRGQCVDKVIGALRRMEVKSLDYLVLSHPHGDHVENIGTVGQYIYDQGGTIGVFWETGFAYRPPYYEAMDCLQKLNVPMKRDMRGGFSCEIGGVKMELLGPTEEKMQRIKDVTGGLVNCASLIQKFTFGKSSYLTSGDLYRKDEREMVAECGSKLHVRLAKVNHHGDYTGSSKEWLTTVSPEFMFVTSDDVGSTVLEEWAMRNGIGFVSVGLEGDILLTMTVDGDWEAETASGKKFCGRA